VVGSNSNDWVGDLARSSGHVVGMVTATGAPSVTRGWGVRIVDGGRRATLLLSTAEVAALGHAGDDPTGTAIALTATDIRTLRTVQVKGVIDLVEPADDDDLQLLAGYRSEFFAVVNELDMLSVELLERIVPDRLTACSFDIREAFDQTPGPGAGRSLPVVG
jgi:hypothetical protein